MSLRDTILAANKLPTEKIDTTAEWGCEVYARVLSGDDRDNYDRWIYEQRKNDQLVIGFRERFLVVALVDEAGNRIFSDDDVATLRAMSNVFIRRLYDVAVKLNNPPVKEEADAQRVQEPAADTGS